MSISGVKLLRSYLITKSNLYELLERISERNKLYAPLRHGDQVVLDLAKSINDILIDYIGHSTLPLKKILIPPREILYEYWIEKKSVTINDNLDKIASERIVIFGIRACDIKSIEILDKVFLREFHDPYYKKRRENTVIIGLTCVSPDKNCFCYFTRSGPEITSGYDLLLTKINEHYLVDVGSEKGESIIISNKELFSDATPESLEVKARIVKETIIKIKDKNDLPFFNEVYDQLVKRFDSREWKEISSLCLSCGKCNFVCPTCTCFDIIDEFDPIRNRGKRIRVWDSCHFLSFTRVASGEIFRKDRSSRIKQRIYHKIVYSVNDIGTISCTGCGRCIEVCPVGIDIREIVRNLAR